MNALDRLQDRVERALGGYGDMAVRELVDALSVPGSVDPFIASPPGEPSFNWDDELTSGISRDLEVTADGPMLHIFSAGVSIPQTGSRHIAADAEFGHWWDGWAFDTREGKWKKCASPHFVEPRPHMAPAMQRAREEVLAYVRGAAHV